MIRSFVKVLSNYLVQYFLALIFMGSMLTILFLNPIGKTSLELPDDDSSINHPWKSGDIMTYVEPARAFLNIGTFARGGKPDMHRTIGYPAFLALAMWLFGDFWLPAVYVLQLTIFATLFPATSIIAKIWFPDSKYLPSIVFVFMIILGIGGSYTGLLMSDMLFASLLITGIACGLMSVTRLSWKLTFVHLGLISWAAQIRPTLSFFFISNIIFMIFTARKIEVPQKRKLLSIIIFSGIVLAITGNTPAIRNFVNHGIFTSTNVFSNNLARYLAGPVMIMVGQQEEYFVKLSEFKMLNGLVQIQEQNKFALNVIEKYPFVVTCRILYHVFWNLFEPHWEYIGNAFGVGFSMNRIIDKNGKINRQLIWCVGFWLIYLCIYAACLSFLFNVFVEKQYFFLAGFFIFLLPLAASFINGQGARMRLYVEPLMLVFAFAEIYRYVVLAWSKHDCYDKP